MDEEMRIHVEMEAEELARRQGLDLQEARRRALLAFGGVEQVKERARDVRRVRWLEELVRDARLGVRSMRRAPGFTAVAVLTLALGIGANTAIFSAVNAVILRPLPFEEPDRLVMLAERNPELNWDMQTAAPANALDWREQVPGFADVAMYSDFLEESTLTGAGEPRVLFGAQVTGNFFNVLGVRAALGRTLRSEETWAGSDGIVVLGHRTWLGLFGGDSEVIGRAVELNGRTVRIVGVLPEGFGYPFEEADFWVPMGWDPADRDATRFRRAHWVRPIARLEAGVSPAEARAQLEVVADRLEAEHPETNRGMGAMLMPLHEFLVGERRTPLVVLLSAVGVLLLLACANVGNLLLVRTAARGRDLAVRSALGAGRGRLIRQMATESTLLSTVGGAGGLLLGWVGTRTLSAIRPPELIGASELPLDWRVLAFTLAATIVSALVFGLAPALWSGRARLADALRAGGRWGGPDRGGWRTGRLVVPAEVALALLLVIGAGLLARSFWRLQQVDPGFEPKGVVAASLELPGATYDTDDEIVRFYYELVDRAAAIPGVEAAGATARLPLTGPNWTSSFTADGWAPDEYGTEIIHREIVPGYFRTMRVPIMRGRALTFDDRAAPPYAVVINRALAERYFPDENPVGKRITYDRVADENSVWRTIVGVVGSEHQAGLAAAARPEVYEPLPHNTRTGMTLVVRTRRKPHAVVSALRRVVGEMDPGLALYDVRPMEEVAAESIARQRFVMALLLTFAGIALVLAVVGTYGVTAQLTRRRTQEIGIRLALGARPARVMRQVTVRGVALVGIGVAIGLGLAFLATRTLATLLFGVEPTDATTFAVVAALVFTAGMAAAVIPAYRASRADPTLILRMD